MDLLPATVSDFLSRHALDRSALIVACSGGADSLALAAATLDLLGAGRVRAVTVDHGLQRGSADHARSTVAQLRELGFSGTSTVAVTVPRGPGSGGPEAAARDARYRALSEMSAAFGDAPVLLGHTADDQAETVLLGLARGSGPRSVAGMSPWRQPWGRPLLAVRRADTEGYCLERGLTWWNDPHNIDPAFTRVRLRHEVLPLMDEVLGGGVAPALARTAELLADDLQALDELATLAAGELVGDHGELRLDGPRPLASHPAAIRTRVLRNWAGTQGAGSLVFEHLKRLDQLVIAGRTGMAVRLPGALDVVRRRGLLICEPAAVRPARGG